MGAGPRAFATPRAFDPSPLAHTGPDILSLGAGLTPLLSDETPVLKIMSPLTVTSGRSWRLLLRFLHPVGAAGTVSAGRLVRYTRVSRGLRDMSRRLPRDSSTSNPLPDPRPPRRAFPAPRSRRPVPPRIDQAAAAIPSAASARRSPALLLLLLLLLIRPQGSEAPPRTRTRPNTRPRLGPAASPWEPRSPSR